MREEFCESEQYQIIGAAVMQLRRPDLLDLGIAVGFVSSNKVKKKGKTKIVRGECKKTPELYRLFCPYDFLVIIYDQNCIGMTEHQMQILLWHELLHIEIDEKGEPYVRPHDVEDFDEIIAEYGLRWDR